jgi:lipid A ethanolaminephosphotransferase
MEVLKKYKHQILFHFLLNSIVSLFITLSCYYHIPVYKFKDFSFYAIHFIVLQFSVFGILYFLSLNKYLFKIVFPILFLGFAAIAFWIYTLDIAISGSIVQISLETKPDIVVDLISIPLIIYMILAVLSLILIFRFYTKLTFNSIKSPLTILAILGISGYFLVENYKYGTFKRKMPYNVVAAVKEYQKQNTIVLKSIDTEINSNTKDLSVVFILGESVRADHLQLNGYPRETTPLLSKRTNIISFTNTYTPLTYTAISVPQILSNASLTDDYSEAKYSLIEILNKAKIQTNWIGNQTPEKSFNPFIQQSNFSTIIDPFHSELSFQKSFDENLLPDFKKVFSSNKNQFTVLHMMGSHWWYETRYPDNFRKFKPVIKSKHVNSNSKEEMINSYDNTLLYLDYFINETIKHVEEQNSNSIVIYLSDHGEILGENNLWLHAQSHKSSENPGMLIWFSEKFKQNNEALISRLQSHQNKTIPLDFFFPSILELYKIEGIPYDKQKVIF